MANVTITPQSNEIYQIKKKNSETSYYLKDDAARTALSNIPISLSDGYTSTDTVLSLSSPAAGDSFVTAIGKLHTGLVADELILETGLNDLDSRINNKANSSDVYTKVESDAKYATNDEVDENEMVIAAALNDLHDSISNIHVTGGVSSINGSTGDITGIATETYVNTQVSQKYSKPSGGIPSTDLASSVQTSLGKADTALQSAPVTSVNGQTGAISLNTLPTVTAADNGKILMVVNGAWTLVSPSTLYGGSGVPNNENGNNGDIYTQTD